MLKKKEVRDFFISLGLQQKIAGGLLCTLRRAGTTDARVMFPELIKALYSLDSSSHLFSVTMVCSTRSSAGKTDPAVRKSLRAFQ